MGDASDNVPGVKGIGEKTAVKLINQYQTLDEALSKAGEIEGKTGKLLLEGKQDALKSKELIALKEDAFADYKIDDWKSCALDIKKALEFFKKYEFKSLIEKFSEAPKLEGDLFENVKSAAPAALNSSAEKIAVEPLESEIIDAPEKLENLAKEIKNSDFLSIKTIGSLTPSLKAQIVGISLCFGRKAFYIPIGHDDLTAPQISFDDFKKAFGDILSSKKIKKTSDDLKRERNFYLSKGIEFNGLFFDANLASYCLNPLLRGGIISIAKKYLNFEVLDDSFLGKGAKKISFSQSAVSDAALYANSISYASFKLRDVLEKALKDAKLDDLFFNIEMPLIEILSDMEREGIKIDESYLREFRENIAAQIKKVERKIFDIAGTEFNLNSPKQLGDIMFSKLQLPIIKKTKTGASTDEEVLSELSNYEFAAEVLRYREFQKLRSSYIEPISEFCSFYGDRIHTVFHQTVTSTGRLSSSDPNLQNIPIKSEYGRAFRKIFIADIGKIFISADYSQIDLRALAHISGDEKLIEAFNLGQDIHAATAREVFGISKDEELPQSLRSAAKAINFGIVYGISPFGLSKQLNISVAQAKEYIDGYFKKYEGVKDWMGRVVADAKRDGFVKTITGRIRQMPELFSTNRQVISAGERIVLNTPIQGTSADIIKIAMINIAAELKEKNFESKMLLQVHDDLLFETVKDEKEKLLKLVKDKMESALKLKVPLIVDMKMGDNWADMEKVK
jgi:DNA polymerase-1